MISHPPRVRSTNDSWSTCQDNQSPSSFGASNEARWSSTNRRDKPVKSRSNRETLTNIKVAKPRLRIKRFGEEKSTVFDRASQHRFSWINDQTSLLIRISLRMKQPSRREWKRHRKISSRVGWAKEIHEMPIKHKPREKTPEESRRSKYYRSYHSLEAKAGEAGDSEQPLPRVRARWSGLCTGFYRIKIRRTNTKIALSEKETKEKEEKASKPKTSPSSERFFWR